MAGIGQGGAQVIDVNEAVRTGYAVLGKNLELTNELLNNSAKTKELDFTALEKLDAESQAMDDQEVENDVTIARDWYSEQVQAGRNVNTPKFRAEFRNKMSGITGKVAGIKGMRADIAENIDVLSKLKDPYIDNNSKITNLMSIRHNRPDNWKYEVGKVMNDSSSYKLGDKTKDVSIALGNNTKTVAWERPTGKTDGSGAAMTESVNTTYNPFFEDFDEQTGKVTKKTQLDYDFLSTYLAENEAHASALKTKRVDVQDDIIESMIENGEELNNDQRAWMSMTDSMKMQKALNDDLVGYGREFVSGGKSNEGVGTVGRGESTYFDRQAGTSAIKEKEALAAIANDANTMKTRGVETLNSINYKDGTQPGSFKIRKSESKAGDEIIVVEYDVKEQKYRIQEDPTTGEEVKKAIKGKFETRKVKETFFADDDDSLAKFYRDRAGYNRSYGPEHLRTRAAPLEKEKPKRELTIDDAYGQEAIKNIGNSEKPDPLKKFLDK